MRRTETILLGFRKQYYATRCTLSVHSSVHSLRCCSQTKMDANLNIVDWFPCNCNLWCHFDVILRSRLTTSNGKSSKAQAKNAHCTIQWQIAANRRTGVLPINLVLDLYWPCHLFNWYGEEVTDQGHVAPGLMLWVRTRCSLPFYGATEKVRPDNAAPDSRDGRHKACFNLRAGLFAYYIATNMWLNNVSIVLWHSVRHLKNTHWSQQSFEADAAAVVADSEPLTSSLLAPDWPRPRPCCCCCCRHAAVGTPHKRRQNGSTQKMQATVSPTVKSGQARLDPFVVQHVWFLFRPTDVQAVAKTSDVVQLFTVAADQILTQNAVRQNQILTYSRPRTTLLSRALTPLFDLMPHCQILRFQRPHSI